MDIISRKAAKAAGFIHYWTGKPCKFGHIDKRYVASFCCAECARRKSNEYYAALDVESRRRIICERQEYYHQWCKDNAERLTKYQAARRKLHKQEHPDYFREHYANNRERRKQDSRAWYHSNVERHVERQKAYNSNHVEQVRAAGRRSANKRRAIKAKVFVESVDPKVVFERDRGVCGICKWPVDPSSNWEIDHVIPISRGGVHSYDNVQLAHRTCNRSKWASMPQGQPTFFQVSVS